jgi:hypothetical protein
MAPDDKPDHTKDPRDRDVGAGYPEEQPEGAQPGAERDDEAGENPSSPSTSSGQEGGPGQATGNPNAAG